MSKLNKSYSRRECLDIFGIPSEVEADALVEKVVPIFEKLGCNIMTECIERLNALPQDQ